MTLMFANAVFGPPQVIMTFEPAKDVTTDEIYIDTTQVSKFFALCVLGAGAVYVYILILVTAWNDFLFTITDSCTLTHDCFAFINGSSPFNNGSAFLSYVVPITNCSDYSNDVKISCFVFTYSFISALATFGGLLTAIRYLSIALFKVQFWIYRTLCISNYAIRLLISSCFFVLSNFFMMGILLLNHSRTKNEAFIANDFASFLYQFMFPGCIMMISGSPLFFFAFPPQLRQQLSHAPHEANRGTTNDSNDERQPLLSGADNV